MERDQEILKLKNEIELLKKNKDTDQELLSRTVAYANLSNSKLSYYKRKQDNIKLRVDNILKLIALNEEPEIEDIELHKAV